MSIETARLPAQPRALWEMAMHGKFMLGTAIMPEVLDWGRLGWLSSPATTGSGNLTVIAGTYFPGKGHSFHHHPEQEEVIYVLAGTVEQWLERERRILGVGDAVYIPAGMVHATFNAGGEDARVLAILGPCVGEAGVAQVDDSGEAPWSTLRSVS